MLSPLQQTGVLFHDLVEEPVTREQTEIVMVSTEAPNSFEQILIRL
jgi:hypothetical protein